MKSKSIQIPEELFLDLVRFFYVDAFSAEELQTLETRIRRGLSQKLDAIASRDAYTRYKTAPTEEEREAARREYLDQRGIHASFRR